MNMMMWTNNQPQVFVQNCHPSSWNDGLLGSFKIQSHFASGNSPTALSTRSLLLTHTELQSLWRDWRKTSLPHTHTHARSLEFTLYFELSILAFWTFLHGLQCLDWRKTSLPHSRRASYSRPFTQVHIIFWAFDLSFWTFYMACNV